MGVLGALVNAFETSVRCVIPDMVDGERHTAFHCRVTGSPPSFHCLSLPCHRQPTVISLPFTVGLLPGHGEPSDAPPLSLPLSLIFFHSTLLLSSPLFSIPHPPPAFSPVHVCASSLLPPLPVRGRATSMGSGGSAQGMKPIEPGRSKRAGTSPVNARRLWKGRSIFSRATENGPAFSVCFACTPRSAGPLAAAAAG